jgi:hypothetical protein
MEVYGEWSVELSAVGLPPGSHDSECLMEGRSRVTDHPGWGTQVCASPPWWCWLDGVRSGPSMSSTPRGKVLPT